MLCSLLRLSCRKMGAESEIGLNSTPKGLILRRNGFQVIINDYLLVEGECHGIPTLRITYRIISVSDNRVGK